MGKLITWQIADTVLVWLVFFIALYTTGDTEKAVNITILVASVATITAAVAAGVVSVATITAAVAALGTSIADVVTNGTNTITAAGITIIIIAVIIVAVGAVATKLQISKTKVAVTYAIQFVVTLSSILYYIL